MGRKGRRVGRRVEGSKGLGWVVSVRECASAREARRGCEANTNTLSAVSARALTAERSIASQPHPIARHPDPQQAKASIFWFGVSDLPSAAWRQVEYRDARAYMLRVAGQFRSMLRLPRKEGARERGQYGSMPREVLGDVRVTRRRHDAEERTPPRDSSWSPSATLVRLVATSPTARVRWWSACAPRRYLGRAHPHPSTLRPFGRPFDPPPQKTSDPSDPSEDPTLPYPTLP